MGAFGGGISEEIQFAFDKRSLLQSLKDVNTQFDAVEKGATGAADKWNTAFTRLTDQIIKITDKSTQAQERYLKSLERTAAAAGKTGVEKLILQRDQLIKKYEGEEKAILRVKAAYDKLIAAEQNQNRGGGHGGGTGINLLRSARDFFEGRQAYGLVQAGNALKGLEGIPLVLGGVAAGLTGLAVAGYKATEALAAWGVAQKDVQERTGLTAKELAQFEFAAKRTGQDISVFERGMRGLATAMEDFSPAGDKARKTMSDIGFSFQDAQGQAKPVGQAMIELSEALSHLPPGTQRAKDALDILKRAGIEGIPAFIGLADSVKRFNELELPFAKQNEIDQGVAYANQIAEINTRLSALWRTVEEGLARGYVNTMHSLFLSATSGPPLLPGFGSGPGGIPAVPSFISGAAPTLPVTRPPRGGASASDAPLLDFLNKPGPGAVGAGKFLETFGGQTLEAAQRAETLAKTNLDAALKQVQLDKDNAAITQEAAQKHQQTVKDTNAEYDKRRNIVKEITKQESNAVAALEAIRKANIEITDKLNHPFGQTNSDKILEEFARRPGVTRDVGAGLLPQFTSQGYKQFQSLQTALQPLREQEAQDAIQKATARARESTDQIAEAEGAAPQAKSGLDLVNKQRQQTAAASKEMEDGIKRTDEALALNVKHLESILETEKKINEEQGLGAIKLAQINSPDTVRNRLSAEASIRDIQIRAADEEFQKQKDIIDAKYVAQNQLKDKEIALADERLKQEEAIGKARLEFAEKAAEEVRKQVDEIKSTAEKLFDTLFTNPKKFGSQLASTVRGAALKPLTGGLSELTARSLQPLIFGKEGTGGLAGAANIFGNVKSTGGALHVFVVNPESPSQSNPLLSPAAVATEAKPKPVGPSGNFADLIKQVGGVPAEVQQANVHFPPILQTPPEIGKILSPFIPRAFGTSSISFRPPVGPPAPVEVAPQVTPTTSSTVSGGGTPFGGYGFGSVLGPLLSIAGVAQSVSPRATAAPPVPAGVVSSTIDFGGGPVNLGSTTYGSSVSAGGPVGYSEAVPYATSDYGLPDFVGGGPGGFGVPPGGGGTGLGGFQFPVGIAKRAFAGNFSGNFQNLKGAFGNLKTGFGIGTASAFPHAAAGDPNLLSTESANAITSSSSTTIGSVLSSPGAASVMTGIGVPLATAGFTRVHKGTGIGILEGTAGGALTGAGIGTMILPGIGTAIGAGVGAAVGALTSGIEALTGDISPREKAKRDVKNRYHVNIGNAEADQIAAIAHSKYGDNVNLAVASPEVRQMLGLYAFGTGQGENAPISADTPHGASFVESGGKLFQQAVYQYGNREAYQSSLPLYGGDNAKTIPTASNPSIALNISGAGIAPFLTGNVVTPSYVASAANQAWNGSDGRTNTSLQFQEPGSIVS